MRRILPFNELLSENRFLGPAIGLTAGTAEAFLLSEQYSTPLLWKAGAFFVFVTFVLAAAISKFRGGQPKGNALFAVCLLLAFAGLGTLNYAFRNNSNCLSWPHTPQSVFGIIQSPPRETAKTFLCDVKLKGPYEGRKVRVRLMKKQGVVPQPGDELLLHGKIEPPRNSGNPGSPDFAAIQRRQDISGTMFCYTNAWKPTGKVDRSPTLRALRLRGEMIQQYRQYFSGRDLAVLSALTLGDKSMLNADIREVFSNTGTSHILALSGLHLGILFGIYNVLLLSFFKRRRVVYVPLCLMGIVGIWAFALLVGLPLSLIRAAVMCTIVQLTLMGQGDIFSLNNLSIAALFILFVWPDAVSDVGFQLSFLSVTGILLFYPLFPALPFFGRKWYQRVMHGVARFFYGTLCVSLCAIVATAPLTAYTFHTLPLYGLAASLVAIPMAYPLLLLGLLFFIVPIAQSWFAAAIGGVLQTLFYCLEGIASWPAAAIQVYPTLLGTLALYAALLLLYSFLSRPRLLAACVVILTLVVCVCIEVNDYRRHTLKPQIVFYQNHQALSLHLIASTQESYLWSTAPERADSALSYVRRTFWNREGLTEPHLLKQDTTTNHLVYTPHCIQFFDKRIGLLYQRIKASPHEPLHVHYLYVVRGWNHPLREAFNLFNPDTLVLDTSLSDYYRTRYTAEADSLHLPVKDLHRDGALVVEINQH